MNRIQQIHRMVGWRGLGWLAASMLFSLAYSGVELLFAYFFSHLLFLLKVSGGDPQPPFFLPAFFQTKEGSLPFLMLIGVARTVLRVQAAQSVVLFGEIIRSRLRFSFFRKIYGPRSQRCRLRRSTHGLPTFSRRPPTLPSPWETCLLTRCRLCRFSPSC